MYTQKSLRQHQPKRDANLTIVVTEVARADVKRARGAGDDETGRYQLIVLFRVCRCIVDRE